MPEIILGIESSCDDTSAAVIKDGYLLSNVLASQDVHKAYGGVIPELASRAHQRLSYATDICCQMSLPVRMFISPMEE